MPETKSQKNKGVGASAASAHPTYSATAENRRNPERNMATSARAQREYLEHVTDEKSRAHEQEESLSARR